MYLFVIVYKGKGYSVTFNPDTKEVYSRFIEGISREAIRLQLEQDVRKAAYEIIKSY